MPGLEAYACTSHKREFGEAHGSPACGFAVPWVYPILCIRKAWFGAKLPQSVSGPMGVC